MPVHRTNGHSKRGRNAPGYTYFLPYFLAVALVTLLSWHFLSRGESGQGSASEAGVEQQAHADAAAWPPPPVIHATPVSEAAAPVPQGVKDSDTEEQLYLFAQLVDRGDAGCLNYKNENSPVGHMTWSHA